MAQERNIEGEVIILIYIGVDCRMHSFPLESPDGNISFVDYFIISEEPADWFFADNLIKVFPEWSFLPRIEKGKAIGSYLKIKYSFCLGITCSRNDEKQIHGAGKQW